MKTLLDNLSYDARMVYEAANKLRRHPEKKQNLCIVGAHRARAYSIIIELNESGIIYVKPTDLEDGGCELTYWLPSDPEFESVFHIRDKD